MSAKQRGGFEHRVADCPRGEQAEILGSQAGGAHMSDPRHMPGKKDLTPCRWVSLL